MTSDLTTLTLPSNKRPETCPRFQLPFHSKFCGLYEKSSNILTVGDGDFSFSLSLINAGHKTNRLTATSYESYDSVTTVYTNSKSILNQITKSGVKILHNVDATNLNKTPQILLNTYDIIVWNFPCIGIEHGADGQAEHIQKNQELLTIFFHNAWKYLNINNKKEIHITHKTIEPFSWWDIINIGINCNYSYLGSVIFDR